MKPHECFVGDMSEGDVRAAYPEWTPQFLTAAFKHWYDSYCHRSTLYYRQRWDNHWLFVRELFAKKTGLGVYESLYGNDAVAWSDFAESHNLPEIEFITRNELRALAHLETNVNPNKEYLVSSRDIANRMLEHMESTELMPDMDVVERVLYQVWFDKIISNPPDVVNRLRSMPYPDYLKSDHWLRVRTAMLIAHGFHCQGSSCEGWESYLGEEQYLHVHHINYKNRGNERFADLRLLCNTCHKKVHEVGNAALSQYHEFYYQSPLEHWREWLLP